jgi:alkylation response protein AidB-like acyl-CoA dehydrogenase
MGASWWDDVHRTLWGVSGRPDLRQLMQTARRVAQGVVSEVVAAGGRSTHLWTPEKARMLQALDDAGLTSIVAGASGGLAIPLAAALWELAWVDGGAAVCALSGALAQMIVRDAGTAEQQSLYIDSALHHGALCVTEPVPGAGADAAALDGRIRIMEWNPGREPVLEVVKNGRFTSHMDFADFVVAAVDSRDERFLGSCLVLLEPADAGVFDRGEPVRKLGHQLSSTTNPMFRLKVPAGRILGGYAIENGTIVPKLNHREALGAAFRRMRAVISLVTSAKLLCAMETVITTHADLPEHLLDVWAAGEAAASLGFSAARLSDDVDNAAAERTFLETQAAVICPAAKLFSTETTCAMLPKVAASLSNYGSGPIGSEPIIDAQLETVYLGPNAIQRRQISAFMIDDAFQTQFNSWTREMRELARHAPYVSPLAAAMELWSWTLDHLRRARGPDGLLLFRDARQSVIFPMADALSELLAARALTMDVLTLSEPWQTFYKDLAMIQSVHAAGRAAQICSGFLFGHQTMVALRAKLYASFAGLRLARSRAIEFIRNLDPETRFEP